MASKVERLKQRLRSMREKTEVVATNALHAGETLVLGSAGAYAEGRMSDSDGEWGYKKVPYLYMGGAVLFLTGLFAGERYGADLFAAGTGLVGGHLFRTLYETGLESKTTGLRGGQRRPSELSSGMRTGIPHQREGAPVRHGTALDGLRSGNV